MLNKKISNRELKISKNSFVYKGSVIQLSNISLVTIEKEKTEVPGIVKILLFTGACIAVLGNH